MNIAHAKCISLAVYRERQGLSPQKSCVGGRELWYHSPIRGGDKTRPSRSIRSRSCGLSMGQLWVVLSSTSCEISALTMYATCSNISTRPGSIPRRSRLRAPQHGVHGALRSGLIQCQKIRFLGVKKKKVLAWNWWTASRLSIQFSQYLTKWDIDYYIASKHLLQIYFKPPGDALSYLPLVTLLDGVLRPVTSYLRVL